MIGRAANDLMRRLLIRPGAIGDVILSLPTLEAARADYTEVWAPRAVLPLIRFADRTRAIADTGLELVGVVEGADVTALENLRFYLLLVRDESARISRRRAPSAVYVFPGAAAARRRNPAYCGSPGGKGELRGDSSFRQQCRETLAVSATFAPSRKSSTFL